MNDTTYVFSNTSFTDLILYQFGIEQCPALLACGPAIRRHYLLHYILSGKGTFTPVSGVEYKLCRGQAFLIHPNSMSFYCADQTDPWQYIWVEFDGLKASTFLQDAGLTLKNPIYTPRSGFNGEIERQLYALIDNHGETAPKLIGMLYLLIDTLIKSSICKRTNNDGNLREFYIREAINYIEQNYAENIGVDDIANWCNLNRSYFGKLFKDTVLVTPSEYLSKYRFNMACEMLQDENLPIADIAERVGYENPLNFSRAFKKIYGVSPREWRKINVNSK